MVRRIYLRRFLAGKTGMFGWSMACKACRSARRSSLKPFFKSGRNPSSNPKLNSRTKERNVQMQEFKAYAASQPKGKLEPFSFDPGPLAPEDVEIKVTH